MTLVSLEKSLDGDMAALIFWDFSTGNEVFAVVSVQSGVNHLLRHGCASDMLNPKGCIGVSVYEAASQRRFAAGRKVEPWNALCTPRLNKLYELNAVVDATTRFSWRSPGRACLRLRVREPCR